MGGRGSGGARERSGPAPDPGALVRQRDGKEWVKLPAAGRLDPAPEWPLAIDPPSENELLKWREMWTMPQALIWETDRANDLVAFYVRTFLEGMKNRAGAQARMFVRQLSNDLFLSPDALARGRYVIEGTSEAKALEASVMRHPAGSGRGNDVAPGGARGRFRVVPSGPTTLAEDDDEDDAIQDTAPDADDSDNEGNDPPF